jgi:flagellar hook assembly protein FlgD
MAIFYKTDNPGYTSTVKVFDAEGRPVKTLTNNELLSTEGFLRWDGDTDEDIKAKTGIYIIWIQLFNPDGNGEEYKYAVVLANKL